MVEDDAAPLPAFTRKTAFSKMPTPHEVVRRASEISFGRFDLVSRNDQHDLMHELESRMHRAEAENQRLRESRGYMSIVEQRLVTAQIKVLLSHRSPTCIASAMYPPSLCVE